jgi:putative ABC transport system ATP-binding protein
MTADGSRAFSAAAARPDCVLELSAIGKSYGGGARQFKAVSGVSLSIERGEVVALVGPSGSGKTTLLSIMGCILRPSEGRLSVCGTNVTDLDENERSRMRLAHIGFIFQSYNLLSTLTASQNVQIALELKGAAARERVDQAEALLASLGLADKVDSRPADLSGGQKQRVAIARALAGSPDVILADEPTAALDSDTGRRVMNTLRELAAGQSRAVVVVTHDRRLLNLVDRIITIEDGRIVSDEPEFMSSPLLAGAAGRTLIWRPSPPQTQDQSP